MAAERFAVGELVFVPDPDDAFVLRKVHSCGKGSGADARLEVTRVDGKGGVEAVRDALAVVEADPLSVDGAEDMVKFTNLTAAALLHNLRVRYARDQMYSCAGSILISVNPFKQLNIYTEKEMQRCKDADVKELQELPPHVYVIAEGAFRGMLVEQKMQAILISGESGAGKTEAAKACVKYIVARSHAASISDGSESQGNAKFIEKCIISANPLLEAFGNAKTVRNSNSSRFGKWVEIQFDASGFISSSKATSYLLEKSRVVEHAQGERTYHVLYQLCKGCSAQELRELHISDASAFKYLERSAKMQVIGIDDVKQWKETVEAMGDFKLQDQEQLFVRRLLSGLLHLGNLRFDAVQLSSQDDGSCVSPSCATTLKSVAAMLGVGEPGLEQALTVKSVGKFPVVQVPQPPEKAAAARDALAKALYGHLFEWLIARINEEMRSNAAAAAAADSKRKIGLLDIFGFEAFAKNSLEQLLINYANERLQQFFNVYIFRLEEQECRSEGVECPKLEFADNSAVMSLLESKPTGVLSLVNEEVLVPNASDTNLLSKMQQSHRAHSAFKTMPRSQADGFTILHFAGDVSYEIEGFVDKSRDALPSELTVLVAGSSMPQLPAMFKPSEGEGGTAARGGGARARSGGGGRRVVSLGRQFQDSLDSLMGMLDLTAPHFIRCVKPNAALVSDSYDGVYVMRQLEQMGMVHVVRARKQGYAHRYPFDRFISRYGYLKDGLVEDAATCAAYFERHLGTRSPPPGDRASTVALLATLASAGQFDSSGWAVGTGKLFMKAAQQQQLEVAREAYLRRVITEQLRAAIAARDFDKLDKAVAAAVEMRLGGELVSEAQRMLSLLRAQREAESRLKEAILARDVARLESAVANAAQVSLGGDVIAEAQRLLALLRAQQSAATALSSALHSNDADRLRHALEQARQSGLNTGLVQEAQRRLDGLQKGSQIEAELREATAGTNLLHLSNVLNQAEEIGMSGEAIKAAHRQLAALQESAQLNSQLQQAMGARDAVALKALIARAPSLQCAPSDELRQTLDASRAMLAEIEARSMEVDQQSFEQQQQQRAQHEEDLAAAAAAAAAGAAGVAAYVQPPSATPSHMGLVPSDSFEASQPSLEMQVDPAPEAMTGMACLPLSVRAGRLQAGSTLIKVAQGKYARHKQDAKVVHLSPDCRTLTWEGTKKSVELAQVLRVSIGLETRTLQKLYQGNALVADMPSYHWFSLHTATRSYDFGIKDCGDENEMVVLWVLTLQEIVATLPPPSANISRTLTGLSLAQQQWQRFETAGKEWPCVECTFLNPPSASGGQCASCGTARPLVTLCPCITPLLPMLRALATTISVKAFERGPDAHLLWFLLQALELQPPPPLKWRMGIRRDDPSQMLLGVCSADGADFTVDHPHLRSLRYQAAGLRAQINSSAGAQVPPLPQLFISPDDQTDVSPQGTPQEDEQRRILQDLGLPERDVAEALAAEASLVSPNGALNAPTPAQQAQQAQMAQVQGAARSGQQQRASDFLEHPLDAADVFRHCMSGSVKDVKRFLELGGHADTVYKSAYGWDVGPDWLFTKPSDGTTVLNYVATWTDVIGPPAAELVRMLLQAGADPRRDDGLEQWFTPMHNAVANGARDVVEVILQMHPEAVNYTTGDGRTPVFMLALCDDGVDRMATLNVLLKFNAKLDFAEPFEGNTAMHTLARAGFSEVVARLLEVGASAAIANEAGLTPLQEARKVLETLEQEGESNTAVRRARLQETIQVMELDAAVN